MSALEQEVQQGSASAVTTEAVIVTVQVPGAGLDTPLSAVTVKTTPYKFVRIRGIVWVSSAVATHFTGVLCRRGTTIAGTQVGNTLAQQTATTDPTGGAFVSFEFLDVAPVGLTYVITASLGSSANVSGLASASGFDG
jgi:hypothetical protein